MEQTLEDVRAESSRLFESVATQDRLFRARRKLIQDAGQSLKDRWKVAGPHSTDQTLHFNELVWAINEILVDLNKQNLRNVEESMNLYLTLLVPENLSEAEKIAYANKIAEDMRRRENEFMPMKLIELDRMEKATKDLADFVNSKASSEEVDLESNASIDDQGIDGSGVRAESSDSAIDDQSDNVFLSTVSQREFLDSPHYRRLAVPLFTLYRDVSKDFFELMTEWTDTERQFQAAFVKWRSSNPPPGRQTQWVIEHVMESRNQLATLTAMTRQIILDAKQANRTFEASMHQSPASVIDALRSFSNVRITQFEEEYPLVLAGMQQGILNGEMIIQYIHEILAVSDSTRRRSFRRRNK